MRIWHKKLLPVLCRQHLLGTWRESLGAYKIITEGKNGYRNHPATQEYINAPGKLHSHLRAIRNEMLSRGYNPKALPLKPKITGEIKVWQTLEEQIEVLRAKGCECKLGEEL